jgi:hypothetical protein
MALSPPSSPIAHPTSPTNLPTQTYHISILPRSIPTPALLDSAVGGAHYSGVESVNERRRSIRSSNTHHQLNADEIGTGLGRRRSTVVAEQNAFHLTVLDDLKDVRGSYRPNSLCFSLMEVRCTRVSRQRKCCRSDGGRMRNSRCVVPSDQSPTLISSDCSLDGYMQDPYTRCKGLNEIASQVNHHCSPLSILLLNSH